MQCFIEIPSRLVTGRGGMVTKGVEENQQRLLVGMRLDKRFSKPSNSTLRMDKIEMQINNNNTIPKVIMQRPQGRVKALTM